MKLLILTLCVASAAADVSHVVDKNEQNAAIVRQDLDMGPDGTFGWAFETENGIQASASGSVNNPDSEDAEQVVQGDAKWYAPDGQEIRIQYVADKNGYQPQGSHLPTPPPIPPEILKALEYIQAHPTPPEN